MASSIELKFGDGDYLFALKVPQILELQRACGDTGIFKIYGRVLKGRYVLQGSEVPFGMPHECEAYLGDVLDTIRLGLLGGAHGMVNGAEVTVSAIRARELVEAYCFPAVPLKESWDVAAAVLSATIEGYEAQKKSPEPVQDAPPKASTKRRRSATAP